MKKRGLLITIFSLAIVMLAGVTCFAFGNKLSANVVERKTSATKSATGLLNLGDKWDINLKYTPDEQSMKASTVQYVYEYSFTNTSSANSLLLKKLSSSVIDNMTITYAYSSTPVTNYSNLVGQSYEDAILEAGNQCYIYMIVSVTDTSEIASYEDNLEWAIGKPVPLTADMGDGSTKTVYAIDGMQMPDITAPEKENYIFEGWYTDSACTIPVTFPNSFTSGQKLYPKYTPLITTGELPSDWINGSAVVRGTSPLPNHLTLPSGVTSIEEGAFEGCTELISVTMLTPVDIGVNAFKGCTNLQSVTMHLEYMATFGIGNIYAGSFENCSSLTSVQLIYGATFPECWVFDCDLFNFSCDSITSQEVANYFITYCSVDWYLYYDEKV